MAGTAGVDWERWCIVLVIVERDGHTQAGFQVAVSCR